MKPPLSANPPQQCEHCGKLALYGIEDRCRACNDPVAKKASNVRLASQRDQREALDVRYHAASELAKEDGTADSLAELENIAESTAAVVNVPVGMAYDLFQRERLLYSSYERQVRARLRSPSDHQHDRQRRAVGGLLYGGYSGDMVYAALSADGHGLSSYGPVNLILEEVTIAYRATVLEENSYHFMERHAMTPESPVPRGYLALWAERGKLATAKLGGQVTPGMDGRALSKLLLDSSGDRQLESFLEVHIYGTFNYQAILDVELPAEDSNEWQKLNEVEVVQAHYLQQRRSTLEAGPKT
jgi:hypothetical protein